MKHVPFFANTPDNTHCLQAALRMVLKYYLPDKEYSWEELEKLTAKKEGLWTWVMQGVINMRKLGFEVIVREDFDYEQFIAKGGEYLKERNGEAVAREMIRHSDIEQERTISKEFIKLLGNKSIPASLNELKKLIKDDYLVIANVNLKMLNGQEGYDGHFVVIYGFDDESLYIHDPGLPPQKERKVSYEQFRKAWEYPNEDSKGFMAFKKDS